MRGRIILTSLSAPALLLAAPHASAQTLPPELQAFDEQLPGSLINDPRDLLWQTQGPLEVEGIQDDEIPGGGAARRYTIAAKDANIWTSQTYAPLLADIGRGEVVTVGFHARTVSADTADGKGVIGVRFQQNAAPYDGFADTTVSVGPDWQWYEVSGTAPMSIKQENATVVFQLAGAKQTIEIGQTIVVKGAASIASVPQTAEPEPVASDEPLVPELLADAGTLLNRPDLRNWVNNQVVGTVEDRDDPSIWLGRSSRYSITALGENDWDLSANIPIEQPIAAGDKLLVAIAAKTVSSQATDGKSLVTMRIQDNTPPYDGFAQNLFKVGENWQLIRVNTVAPRDMPAGTAQLSLHFGAEVQSVDIGPVYIFKVD